MADDNKIKLLCLSDYAHTGFGRVMREVLKRLVATGRFEVRQVAWCFHGDPDTYEDAAAIGIKLYPGSQEWGRAWATKLLRDAKDPGAWKPDLIFSLGDPWMIDWIADLQEALEDKTPWVAYLPIDRPVLSKSWERGLNLPDHLVLYSKFGVRIVEEQLPGRAPDFIPHGVDTSVFRPLPPGAKLGIREAFTIPADAFTVGMVCRNQVRKNIPAGFAIFKAFNCVCCVDQDRRRAGSDTYGYPLAPEQHYSCPVCGDFAQDPVKSSSRLYLHMTMGESDLDRQAGAWSIAELVMRYGVRDRVHGTPGLTVLKGVSDENLNRVYNALHVMLLPTTREGFGLPILEAASAGIPTLATDCSSVTELLEGGCGIGIEVAFWNCDPFFEADSAYVDVFDGAQKLHRLFTDKSLLVETAARARQFARANDWDAFTDDWVALLTKAAGRAEESQPALALVGDEPKE